MTHPYLRMDKSIPVDGEFGTARHSGRWVLEQRTRGRGVAMADTLWFDSAAWAVWLAPFCGLLAAGLSRRKDPVIEGDKVLRHDLPARITHWAHGVGTTMLLVSGIALGLFFTPTLASGSEQVRTWMNVHFVFVVLFLFGTFYYAGNAWLAPKRFKEHLPTKNAVEYTKRHYGRMLGIKEYAYPPEKKYFESERMAYLLAVGSAGLIILTGLIKVTAHAINVPGWVMAIVTPLHDIATVAMALFFIAHIIAGSILPASWPLLRSMFTGYVDVDYVKEAHPGWLADIETSEEPEQNTVPAPRRVAETRS